MLRVPAGLAGMLAAGATPAHSGCYADPARLEAAMRVVVGSYKCDGFRQAITGKSYTVFMSRTGIIDQTTGPCQREISELVSTLSLEAVKGRAAYCASVTGALDADQKMNDVAVEVGAR